MKARMRAGEAATGFWVELFSPAVPEVMAAAGYDCAMIDLALRRDRARAGAVALKEAAGRR